VCGSGQTCSNKQCVLNPNAPSGDCIFGDDLASGNDIGNIFAVTPALVTCNTMIQLLQSNGYDPVW
jgi:hypothetical protein